MRINLIYIIFTVVFVACSNRQHVEIVEYYPTGEIKVKRVFAIRRDTTTYHEKTFFLNGELKMRGNYVNGLREGVWQGGYPDGELKWIVEYEHGIVKPIIEAPYWQIRFFEEGKPKFQVGKPLKFRIFIEGVWFKDWIIGLTRAELETPTEENDFWYIVTPQREGNMLFEVGFMCKRLGEKYGENVYVILWSDVIDVLPAVE